MALSVEQVEREAFRTMFSTRQPLSMGQIAGLLAVHEADLEAPLGELRESGNLLSDDNGLITGISGLSVSPTRHELRIGTISRWTWCAWDALALAALQTGKRKVITASPFTRQPIVVRFTDADLQSDPDGAVLLYPERREDCVTVRDWCPLVNMFESPDSARAWMAEHDVTGKIQELTEAVEKGVKSFSRLLEPAESPRLWWRRLPRRARR